MEDYDWRKYFSGKFHITLLWREFSTHHNSLKKRWKIKLLIYLESPEQWIYVSGDDIFAGEVDCFGIDSIIKISWRTTHLKTFTSIIVLSPVQPVWNGPMFFICIPMSTVYKFHALILKTSIMASITETFINPLLKEWEKSF